MVIVRQAAHGQDFETSVLRTPKSGQGSWALQASGFVGWAYQGERRRVPVRIDFGKEEGLRGSSKWALNLDESIAPYLAKGRQPQRMRYEDRTMLLTPERLEFESGVERLDNGIFHVAVLTPMPDVSARMISWWFGTYMQTTEHYRIWHPRDHVWMDWQNKSPGTHVGAHHLVHEYIGGKLHKLRISFLDPLENMGPGATGSDRLFICAKVGLLGRPITVGRMVHAAFDAHWGCELRSHFWLGQVETDLLGGLVQAAGNMPWFRRRAVSRLDAYALEAHCHEEMTTLGRFLPELHSSRHQWSNLSK